ncbi:MAG: IclR family transcriptional regulator [Naasia sp.]|nr:IclR family transcriptional regulator [Naasia sp.]
MAGNTGTLGESLIHRIATILNAFSENDFELTLGALTQRTGLPRSTVHRLVTELVDEGLVDRNPDGTYSVGVGLWELGQYSQVVQLREAALPHLMTLYDATGENAHVAVLSRREALYIVRVAGVSALPTLVRIGARLPLHSTAVGNALLASLDDEPLGEYFAAPLSRETVHTVTDEVRLRERLAEVRKLGYSVVRQEMTLGAFAIAAIVPQGRGATPAAVGVVTHLGREDLGRLAPLIRRTAARIGEDFANRFGGSHPSALLRPKRGGRRPAGERRSV